ncbi:hypothetical protein ACI8AA_23135 [Geodermatophilus sp. SYSU D01180]
MGEDAEPGLERLLAYIRQHLGDPSRWRDPPGYRNGLALCLIDSVWNLTLHYDRHVVPVLAAYRAHRRASGADPERDTASDLVAVITGLGGADEFAARIATRHRTSTHPRAPLKAVALLQAAQLLAEHRVETPDRLLAVAAEDGGALKGGWRRLPGQTSSEAGWRNLLLVAGADEVKPDRMICGFVSDAVDRVVTPRAAAALVRAAAARLGVPVRVLDHAIWRWQSGR